MREDMIYLHTRYAQMYVFITQILNTSVNKPYAYAQNQLPACRKIYIT